MDRDELVNFQQPGVPPRLFSKVSHGIPLTIEDVETLSQAGVHSGSIINYLYTFGRHFHLTAAQVEELHANGASADLIAYMTSPDAHWSFTLF